MDLISAPESTSTKKFTLNRKRFQPAALLHVPTVVLNEEGVIEQVSPSARRLLEYRNDQAVSPSFFSHVHARNLYQIMRDVADMVCFGKQTASWLARLRTGQGRWRWFKISAENRLDDPDAHIVLRLRDV